MTILFGNNGVQNTAGDVPAPPGAGPVGGSATMQGNAQASQFEPFGTIQPAPVTGGAGQTVNSPLSHDQMSRGNIPMNVQPTNVGTGVGTGDSLLAQIARGQVLLNQSTYGQGGFVPQNGGTGAQSQQPGSINTVSQANGIASTLTVASPAVYSGN